MTEEQKEADKWLTDNGYPPKPVYQKFGWKGFICSLFGHVEFKELSKEPGATSGWVRCARCGRRW